MSEQRRGAALTAHASKYLQQLCKHWGHRFAVEYDAQRGRIDFGDGSSAELTARSDAMEIVIDGPAEALDMLQKVVEEHLNRFAHRETDLRYEWQ